MSQVGQLPQHRGAVISGLGGHLKVMERHVPGRLCPGQTELGSIWSL